MSCTSGGKDLFLSQLLHLAVFLLKAVVTATLTQFEERQLVGGTVYNHQGTFVGKPFDLHTERFFGHPALQHRTVIDEQGNGVARKPPFQRDVVYFGIVAIAFFFALQTHAHVDEDDYYEDDGKSQDAVSYHELLVGVQSVCHIASF